METIHKCKEAISPEMYEWEISDIINYITSVHHEYTRENASLIYKQVHHLMYQRKYSELAKVAPVVFLFLHGSLNHVLQEERVLFPGIKFLNTENAGDAKMRCKTFDLVKNSIKDIQNACRSSNEELMLIRQYTNNYQVPDNADILYTKLYDEMREFDHNYSLHLQIEDRVLFPKTLAKGNESCEGSILKFNIKNDSYV